MAGNDIDGEVEVKIVPSHSEASAPTVLIPPSGILDMVKPSPSAGTLHIKTFKEQKNPRSASEMAALVAYYLSDVAAKGEQKQTINAKDIETYFKIADYPLPAAARYTCQNARSSGYLDSAGEGQYKLNAVGHNLIVHNLPREEGKNSNRRGRPSRQQAKRPKKKGK